MQTIFKYPLRLQHSQVVMLPRGFIPLSVQLQNETPMLWALVDTDVAQLVTPLAIVGTGSRFDLPDSYEYVSTIQQDGFVWHVFVVRNP